MHRYNSDFISPNIDGYVNAFIRGKIKYNMNKYTLYTHTITRQTITVWAHTTTLWVNSPHYCCKTTFRAPCSPGSVLYNTNNHSVDTHNHCVDYLTLKHY